jgi:cell division protein FtsW
MAATLGAHPALAEPPRPRRGRVDHVFAEMVLGAVAVGIVFVFSATFPLADRTLDGSGPFAFLTKQVEFALIGLVGLLLVAQASPRGLQRLTVWAALAGIPAMLACRWSPWAHPVNGSYCWLDTPLFRLQPSEFVKIAYVVVMAGILGRPEGNGWTRDRAWRQALVVMVSFLVLLGIQEDMGMALLVVGVTLGMMFMRGFKGWHVGGLAAALFTGGLLLAMHSPPRWQRIAMFLQPWRDPDNAGYHYCQMLAALARGGLGGTGLGMSPDKWGALPTAHTDSIFCVIGGELGLVGGVLLLALILAMATRAFRIGQLSANAAAWHTACGLGFMLALQSLINIGVATVSLPCTGLTLPFISAGGSSLISSMVAAGVILAVSRYQRGETGA